VWVQSNWTPLMIAAVEGHRTVVEYLAGRGADPNLTSPSGTTAAAWARKRGHNELAALLSSMEKMTKEERMAKWGEPQQATTGSAGANMTKEQRQMDKWGGQGTTTAPLFNHTAVVEALAAHEASSPASKKQKTTSGGASSSSAAPQATGDKGKQLIDAAGLRAREAMYQGGDVSSDDVTARELEQTKKLAQRIYDGFHEDLDLKLEREHPCHSQPVLHEAAFRGELDKVKRLVRKGADVNSWWDQLTALHYACMRGLDPVASHLIKKGADVNASSNTGFTPLGAAAINGNLSTVKLLLEAGADASSVTSSDSRLAPAIVEALAERRVMGAADEQEVEITEEERRTLEAELGEVAADVEPRDW